LGYLGSRILLVWLGFLYRILYNLIYTYIHYIYNTNTLVFIRLYRTSCRCSEMPPKKRASRDKLDELDELDELYKELEAREDEISALRHELKSCEEDASKEMRVVQTIFLGDSIEDVVIGYLNQRDVKPSLLHELVAKKSHDWSEMSNDLRNLVEALRNGVGDHWFKDFDGQLHNIEHVIIVFVT
jgi:hypothetical protein